MLTDPNHKLNGNDSYLDSNQNHAFLIGNERLGESVTFAFRKNVISQYIVIDKFAT